LFAADVAFGGFFVAPDFYGSSAVWALNEFGFRAKKIFDSWTSFWGFFHFFISY